MNCACIALSRLEEEEFGGGVGHFVVLADTELGVATVAVREQQLLQRGAEWRQQDGLYAPTSARLRNIEKSEECRSCCQQRTSTRARRRLPAIRCRSRRNRLRAQQRSKLGRSYKRKSHR